MFWSRGVTTSRCSHLLKSPPRRRMKVKPLPCVRVCSSGHRAGAGYIIAHLGRTLNIAQHGHRWLPAPGSWPPPLFAGAKITEEQQPAAKISDTELGGAGRGFQKQFTRARTLE